MSISQLSLFGLLSVFILSLVSCHILKIYRDDKFYSLFHFTGGFLTTILFFGLTLNYTLSFIFTFLVGVIWEIYEVILWKYFLKKKVFKTEMKDTINDLMVDLLGSIIAILFLAAYL